MAQTLVVNQSLIEWCDKQVAEGKKLEICWEGGGDSGWVYFQIDGKNIGDHDDSPEIETLINKMHDELDYGSWAGEFSANGSAVYDPESKAFVGTDSYSENESSEFKTDIKILIHKSLWFDSVSYSIEDEDPDEQNIQTDFQFQIRNGFRTIEHDKVREQIIDVLVKEAERINDEYESVNDEEFIGIWDHNEIQRSEFKVEGDYLVYDIHSISISIRSNIDKDICLSLKHDEDE